MKKIKIWIIFLLSVTIAPIVSSKQVNKSRPGIFRGDSLATIHKFMAASGGEGLLNRAYKAKVPIVMGTDIGSFPWNINETRELEFYVRKGGLSPMDAIKTATLNAARLLQVENKLGQLQKGYIADIIAVKGNPLEDIKLIQQVDFVMKEGKVIKRP